MDELRNKDFSFRKYAWRQFKKNKPAIVSLYLLISFIVLAIFAPFIANDQPLYAKYRGETFYPALQTIFNSTKTDSTINPETGNFEKIQFDITDWRSLPLEKVFWAPIPYAPDKPDRYNREYASPLDEHRYKNSEGDIVVTPFKFRHHLGTDNIGRDLFSGLIHGTRISLLVGVVAMGIASLIGIILGALAGFFGDSYLKTSRARYYLTIIGLFLGIFYGFSVRSYAIGDAFSNGILSGAWQILLSFIILSISIIVFNQLGKLCQFGFMGKKVSVPVDTFVSRGIEVLNSMPRLILIITISAIVERNIWLVMVIIGVTSWTGIARFTRAEFLRLRELEFIQAAQSLGFSHLRIIQKHALPNALAPVFVSIAFGVASAILIESGLSFLGIGVPDEVVTWGSLLSLGRQEFEAWWLVVFPGIAIFLIITVYNLIGEGLRDALDPRLKQ